MNRLKNTLLAAAFVLLALPGVQARAETLYGITFAGDQLLTIDPTTGAGSVVGPINPPIRPIGMDFRGNKLYAWDELGQLLVQLDPATGANLGTTNIGANAFGEGDMAFRSDGIGFLSPVGPPSQLIRFDLTVPNSTLVGPLAVNIDGMAFNAAGVLYGLREKGGELYLIDPATAGLTLVGNTGITMFPNNGGGGLAFNAAGELYAALCNSGGSPSFLFKLDPSTGAATLVGPIGFNGVTGIRFAPVPPGAPAPPSGGVGEGSFAGCADPPSPANEGNFGFGGSGILTWPGSAKQQTPALRLPVLQGPFSGEAGPGADLVPVPPGVAAAPPGLRMRVVNAAFRQSGRSDGQEVAGVAGSLGWAVLAVLGAAVLATLARKALPPW